MAHYYFDIYNDETTRDEEGRAFADLDSARAYAGVGVRALAAESVLKGHLVLDHRIVILDADRRELAVVRFGDVIKVLGVD